MASPAPEARPTALPDVPSTSSSDDGLARRPRDARLIHLILSSLGIHSYQERVPLQLLDFAYRYTSSVLSDSLRLSAEGYTSGTTAASSKRGDTGDGAGAGSGSGITVSALRQAIASRQDYQFATPLPKEFLMEQAAERNRVVLPPVQRGWGVQLPAERYCLTGTGWGLKEEWESEGEEEVVLEAEGGDGEKGAAAGKKAETNGDGNVSMAGMEEDGGEAEEGEGTFEDVFGGADGDEDQNMDDA